jgi:drug/metabolite transporter (DMT)-like permease
LSGWLVLGETMTPRMLAGAGFMLTGVLLAQTRSPQQVEQHGPQPSAVSN